MNKLKVLHVMMNNYGKNTAPYEYTQELNRLDYEITVASYGEPLSELNNINIINLEKPNSNKKYLDKIIFSMSVMKLIKSQSYDIIHVYHYRSAFLLPLFLFPYRKKIIIDVRTGNVSKSQWKSILGNLFTKFECKFFNNKISLDENLGRHIFGPKATFFHLPLGVNTRMFDVAASRNIRRNLGLEQEDKIFFTHGSIDKSRNCLFLVKCFEEAFKSNRNLKLVIAGSGNQFYEIEKYISKNELENNIKLLGFIPYSEIPYLIAASDYGLSYIPISPQYMNQPPLKTAEYLASGKPVLATQTNGNKTFITKQNGVLINDDFQSLLEGITYIQETLFDKINIKNSIKAFEYKRIVSDKLVVIYSLFKKNNEKH